MIDEANWLTLPNDIAEILGDGFDAVICLGNSFSHMPDTTGDRQNQRYFLIVTLLHESLSEHIVIAMVRISH